GISDEALKNFPVDGVEDFNNAARQFFNGKTFLELAEPQRVEYLKKVAAGGALVDATDGRNFRAVEGAWQSDITDMALRMKLHAFYRRARQRLLGLYYSNYPENKVKRDANNVPILRPGDTHQETNPNTKALVTGWDITGEGGAWTWAEEEE